MNRRYFFGRSPALVVVSRDTEKLLIPLLGEVGIFPEVHCYRAEFVEDGAELHLAEACFTGVQNIQDYIALCKTHLENLGYSLFPRDAG